MAREFIFKDKTRYCYIKYVNIIRNPTPVCKLIKMFKFIQRGTHLVLTPLDISRMQSLALMALERKDYKSHENMHTMPVVNMDTQRRV